MESHVIPAIQLIIDKVTSAQIFAPVWLDIMIISLIKCASNAISHVLQALISIPAPHVIQQG